MPGGKGLGAAGPPHAPAPQRGAGASTRTRRRAEEDAAMPEWSDDTYDPNDTQWARLDPTRGVPYDDAAAPSRLSILTTGARSFTLLHACTVTLISSSRRKVGHLAPGAHTCLPAYCSDVLPIAAAVKRQMHDCREASYQPLLAAAVKIVFEFGDMSVQWNAAGSCTSSVCPFRRPVVGAACPTALCPPPPCTITSPRALAFAGACCVAHPLREAPPTAG
jgi:hypothetical protein